MKKLLAIICLIMVSGCAINPIPADAFHPANQDFYKELPDQSFLRNTLVIGQVENVYETDSRITGIEYGKALSKVLGAAHLLAHDSVQVGGNPLLENKHARYRLDAQIVDYRVTSSGFAHVTSGAAVIYALTDTKIDKEVFRRTITSTMEIKKSIFEDSVPLTQRSIEIALGENEAQIARVLAAISAADFDVIPEKQTSLSKKSKGARP